MPSRDQIIRSTQLGVDIQDVLPATSRAMALLSTDLGQTGQLAVVDRFTELLEGLYAHLPLKRSMYAIDPVQRLRLLRQRCSSETPLDPIDFHVEMTEIVTGLRDAHTRYVGPSELEGRVAMLPFLVEAYGPPDAPHYIVSKLASDEAVTGSQRLFREGVEIVTWNGVPMDRAVDRHADDETGGRPDSRRARALESMTLRALQFGPPPDELWVDIGFLDDDLDEHTKRMNWRVVSPRQATTSAQGSGGAVGRRFAVDPAAEAHRRAKKLLFKPELWFDDLTAHRARPSLATVRDGQWIPTTMQDALSAKVWPEEGRRGPRLGYLRLWSFDVADDDAYVAEVIRLLGLLPDRGLIIDLRSNPGGSIWAAERLLQLFTPNQVVPNGFSLMATALTRAMATTRQNANELGQWTASLQDAVATGELYSSAVPITPVDRCNDIGQVYGGPVVAITDPNTYSAGDLFTAGFVDNKIGLLVTVGQATGGGGANVWTADDVDRALLTTDYASSGPLPAGIGYTISVRRATRGGSANGVAIEDVGVRGDFQHVMTRHDLTGSNADLLSHAARIVLGRRRSAMDVTAPTDDTKPLVVRSEGVDWLDVLVDDAFLPSLPVRAPTTRVELPAGWTTVEVRGRTRGKLLQRRVLRAGV